MEILGRIASGELVRDREDSHVKTHKTVLPLLDELFSKCQSGNRANFYQEVDFSRVVGVSICVRTTPEDEIVFAQRPNRKGLTRFVKNRQPEPSSKAVAFFEKDTTPNTYILVTAFIGPYAPAEPWDENWATPESIPFWSTHALLWGVEGTVPGTKTSDRPW